MNDKIDFNNSFNKLLVKQGMSQEVLPLNLELWQKFLARINNHYNDSDQERYILERSSEIASRESMDLNSKLESAQRLASIGRWYYDIRTNRITVPKEFYTLFGLDPNIQELTFEQVQNNISSNSLRNKFDVEKKQRVRNIRRFTVIGMAETNTEQTSRSDRISLQTCVDSNSDFYESILSIERKVVVFYAWIISRFLFCE